MNRKLTEACVLAALMTPVTGCTTTMARPGTSADQTNRDVAECKYEANKSSPGNPLIANDLAMQCLSLRGYIKI